VAEDSKRPVPELPKAPTAEVIDVDDEGGITGLF
jgi:formyltetrahydrofolate synthetase